MNEQEIELRIERMFDRLDAAFMGGTMSQEEYDSAAESINCMAEEMIIKEQVKRIPSWMQ